MGGSVRDGPGVVVSVGETYSPLSLARAKRGINHTGKIAKSGPEKTKWNTKDELKSDVFTWS